MNNATSALMMFVCFLTTLTLGGLVSTERNKADKAISDMAKLEFKIESKLKKGAKRYCVLNGNEADMDGDFRIVSAVYEDAGRQELTSILVDEDSAILSGNPKFSRGECSWILVDSAGFVVWAKKD